MLTLSKKVEYGLISLLHMSSMQRGDLVTAKELSTQYNIPADLLGKVLQALAKNGTVEAIHGVKGGYRLHRAIDSITLGEVIETLEGPVHLAKCQHDPGSCDQFQNCNIRGPVFQIHEQLHNFIYNISLAAFKQPSVPAGLS